MLNKERQAETEVDSSTTDDTTTSSQNAAKPHVGCCTVYVEDKSKLLVEECRTVALPLTFWGFTQGGIKSTNAQFITNAH